MTTNSPYQSASLYVGDLHPSVTEALLFEIFKAVGPVASIRVCRDAVSRRSLGYAYVNFHNVVDAERALDTLNYTPIKGKPCRIMWSHRDPSVRKSGQGNVFIKNLDKSIDNKALYDTFSTFGNILSCKVVTDTKGNSKGYGFVHYETQEAGEQAISKVHGMLLNGKIVFVGQFIPKKERIPGSDPEKFTNLYVKHLPLDYTKKELIDEFEKFGPIQNAVVMKDPEGKSKCFGFVNFQNHEDAVKAVEALHGKKKLGKAEKDIYVSRAQKKNERENFLKKLREERAQKYQGINLYVKYLDDTIDDAKLREAFSQFGTITSCTVMRDDKDNSKGFGFVCFTTPEEASKAVTEMHSSMLVGKPIYVALAERRDLRRAKLEAQYAARAAARMAGNPSLGGPVYAAGTPVFYPPQGPQRQGQGFVYPQGMHVRRWAPPNAGQPGARQGAYQPIPNYMLPVAQRGQRQPRQRGGGQIPAQGGIRPYKFSPNARNQGGPLAAIPKAQTGKGDQQQHALTGVLASATPEERKQILGENLYPRIRAIEPTLAGKLTGMLIESLEVTELLNLIESSEALNEKVAEGIEVLKAHAEQQASEETEPGDAVPGQPRTAVEG